MPKKILNQEFSVERLSENYLFNTEADYSKVFSAYDAELEKDKQLEAKPCPLPDYLEQQGVVDPRDGMGA